MLLYLLDGISGIMVICGMCTARPNQEQWYANSIPQSSTSLFISKDFSPKLKDHLSVDQGGSVYQVFGVLE